ncbi:hypothetical protein GCM10010455_17950 [Microbacterium esteraromaticum]
MAEKRLGMAFEPRSVVAVPLAFGRVGTLLPPADGVGANDHRYRSAMVQHLIADMVHDGLRLRGVTLPQFLDAAPDLPGLSPDRQRRLLRGETGAQFADLAFWASQFPAIATAVARYMETWVPSRAAGQEDRLPR